YNRDTDEYMFDKGSLYTDHLRPVDDWEADYIEQSPRGKTDPEWEVLGFKVTAVEHNVGYDY
ncbi:unnamed protein product, partial [marine sediment metagenome]